MAFLDSSSVLDKLQSASYSGTWCRKGLALISQSEVGDSDYSTITRARFALSRNGSNVTLPHM